MVKVTYGWMLVLALCSPLAHSDSAPTGRNPFQPAASHAAGGDEITRWRLEGVIGDSAGWSGWLSVPGERWLMVNVGDTLASTGWTVSAIDQHSVQVEKSVVDAAGQARHWVRTLPVARSSRNDAIRCVFQR
ncbi:MULTISPECIES: DUF2531 family protein [unclassified Symbiopectobacterium]|uniref:DUF2531 family protein n=1 Tax=unclassified Symbiopectobacterium TaxID=2794573 RepID=UPI0022275496|nr:MULTISPECIES: DUF2531 family protein [unclassified Symbiopectobacterium]MCW2476961.1 DUF2531 family protein [Candidatus Symbiopectobacterium sp. NZEC151]MCW2488330.1 DUF2531 family protein [Candidatus Symbiopectobacterium sp. NZEC127]